MRALRTILLLAAICLFGTRAWADITFQGTTTGEFEPTGGNGPLQFKPGSFGGSSDVISLPVGGESVLSNLGAFEIDKSDLKCSGASCYAENWNSDPPTLTFTLTFHFELPTVAGVQQFTAPISGTIRKTGNSTNFKVNDVSFDFDNTPEWFEFSTKDGQTGSFYLTVNDPASMDLTMNPAHNTVTRTVTGEISGVVVNVPEASALALLALNLLAVPGLLIAVRRRP